MSSTVTFEFQVQATIKQGVEILKEGLTKELLIRGLNDGIYYTTLGDEKEIIGLDALNQGSFEIVARINTQIADGEYTNYKIIE